MTAPPAAPAIRRLTYADLPQVVAIERRSFPTPWSLAMFVLELSKPAGRLPGGVRGRDDGRLPDLLALRHGLAPDERVGRPEPPAPRASPARCCSSLIERIGDPEAQLTLEVRPSNAGRDHALRALRLPLRRRAPALLPGQRRGRADHVAHARDAAGDARGRAGRLAPARFDPRARDELRRHLRGRRDARRGRCAPTSSPRRACTTATAAWCRRSRRGTTWSWSTPWSTTRWRARARALDDVELVAVTQGPGLVGALLVGVATAKGLAAARRLPLAPVDHLQGHVAATYLEPGPMEPPFLCLLASGGHTLLARVTEPGGLRGARAARSTTRRARRSTRARGCSGCRTRAARRCRGWRPRAIPRRSRSRPPARVAGLDFSFAGLKTALLYAVRDLGEEETARRAADLAASYEHAIVEALVLRVERALRRSRARGWRSAAAWRPTARLRERCAGPRGRAEGAAARALHRQRGDDRLGRPLGRAAALPGLPRPRRVRHRQGGASTEGAADDGEPGGPSDGRPAGRDGGSPSSCSPCSASWRCWASATASRLGGGAEPVPPSAAALSVYDGRSPSEPGGSELRVLVELPRPALAERDDLDVAERGRAARLRPLARAARGRRCGRRSARAASSCATRCPTGAPGTASRRRSTPPTSPRSRASACARCRCGGSIPRRASRCRCAARRRPPAAPPAAQDPIAHPRHRRRRARLRRARPRRRPGARRRRPLAVAARDERHGARGDRRGGGRAAADDPRRGLRRRRGRRSTAPPTRCSPASSARSTPTATARSTTRPASRWSASTRPYAAFGDSRGGAGRARRGQARHARRRARPATRGPARPPNGVVGSPGAARTALAAGATEAGAGVPRVDVTVGGRELAGRGGARRRAAAGQRRSSPARSRAPTRPRCCAAAAPRRPRRARPRRRRTRSPRPPRRPPPAPARSSSPTPATARSRCCPPAAPPRPSSA